jgi:dipeptidyl aminopeptidase/acylaminoacyl peptidase
MRAFDVRAIGRLVMLVAAIGIGSTSLLPAQRGAGGRSAANAPAPAPVVTPEIVTEAYLSPPEAIARLVNAPRESNFSYTTASPGARKYFVHPISDGMPTLEQLGRPHYNIAGFQVEYLANRQRALITRSSIAVDLYDWQSGRTTRITAPAGSRIGSTSWSPDGTTLSFMAEFPTATQLWLADPVSGKSRPLGKVSLLATNVTNWEWTADGKSIVAVLVPDGRGPEPKAAPVPTEPLVRINEEGKLKTPTSADLVQSPHEMALIEYYSTGQLALIDVKSGTARKIGSPGMIRTLDASPGGKLFRVTYIDKPFSYFLPMSSFGTTEVVIDETGKTVYQVSKRPLRTTDPDSTPATPGAGGRGQASATLPDTGKRSLTWHPVDNAMMYLQLAPAAPGEKNDSATIAKRHDRVIEWSAPFDSTSTKVLYETPNRVSRVAFSDDARIMFITESGTAGTTELAIYLDEGGRKYEVVKPTGGRDSTSGRGGRAGGGRGGRGGGGGGGSSFVTKVGSRGPSVVMTSTDGKYVFVQGTDTSRAALRDTTKAPHVTVDRIEIKTGTKERIYETATDLTETLSMPLDDDFTKAIVQRESKSVVPQSFLLDLRTKDAKQLTSNTDLMPEMTNAVRKVVWAKRADGHTFRVRVTLPADYKEGTRLPAMFWFYPAEFADQAAYDRGLSGGGRGNTTNRFATYGPRTLAFLTVAGYAVVEPDAPIFAENGQPPNDHYVDDLRDDLYAAINALDTLALIDRERLGLGGHSYGAFSTVNAMVHTPFFKAGIAGDGNYNRTLTPNGFQNERRDLWQGRETYLAMSPFLYADRLNGALLLYHSMEDQNTGTDPINSIRLFHALQGLGKTVALYMYPYEDHGPITRETDLDQWARWVAWLDKYVKNPVKEAKPAAKPIP